MKFPDLRTIHPFHSFLVIAVFFEAMGGLIGWATSPGIDGWYQGLNRSPLNPPDYLFGIMWPLLYLLLAYAFWRVATAPDSRDRRFILTLFSAHMVLNWLWNPLFFIGHELLAAFVLILVLIFTGAMLAWLIYPRSRPAAAAFIPYLLWLLFAGHLSQYIWLHN